MNSFTGMSFKDNGNNFKVAGEINEEIQETHRYPRFFVTDTEELPREGGVVRITGDDCAHAKTVLRMKSGDCAVLCDGKCHEAAARLEHYDGGSVYFNAEVPRDSTGECRAQLTLYFSSMKGDKNEFVVQKAVELGAARIVPLITKRCVSRPDEKSARRKIEKYRRIAYEAAKQCGRGIIPEVSEFTDFSKMLKMFEEVSNRGGLSAKEQGIMFYELALQTAKARFESLTELKAVSIITGCEGGFTHEEAEAASKAGFSLCTLGRRILRAETAPIAALTLILHELGEL